MSGTRPAHPERDGRKGCTTGGLMSFAIRWMKVRWLISAGRVWVPCAPVESAHCPRTVVDAHLGVLGDGRSIGSLLGVDTGQLRGRTVICYDPSLQP